MGKETHCHFLVHHHGVQSVQFYLRQIVACVLALSNALVQVHSRLHQVFHFHCPLVQTKYLASLQSIHSNAFLFLLVKAISFGRLLFLYDEWRAFIGLNLLTAIQGARRLWRSVLYLARRREYFFLGCIDWVVWVEWPLGVICKTLCSLNIVTLLRTSLCLHLLAQQLTLPLLRTNIRNNFTQPQLIWLALASGVVHFSSACRLLMYNWFIESSVLDWSMLIIIIPLPWVQRFIIIYSPQFGSKSFVVSIRRKGLPKGCKNPLFFFFFAHDSWTSHLFGCQTSPGEDKLTTVNST